MIFGLIIRGMMTASRIGVVKAVYTANKGGSKNLNKNIIKSLIYDENALVKITQKGVTKEVAVLLNRLKSVKKIDKHLLNYTAGLLDISPNSVKGIIKLMTQSKKAKDSVKGKNFVKIFSFIDSKISSNTIKGVKSVLHKRVTTIHALDFVKTLKTDLKNIIPKRFSHFFPDFEKRIDEIFKDGKTYTTDQLNRATKFIDKLNEPYIFYKLMRELGINLGNITRNRQVNALFDEIIATMENIFK